MLKRIDAVGLVGVALLAIGLLFFFFSRGHPSNPNIWRDWLLAFVLVMVGGALGIAWPLIRLASTGEKSKPTETKAAARTGGPGPRH